MTDEQMQEEMAAIYAEEMATLLSWEAQITLDMQDYRADQAV